MADGTHSVGLAVDGDVGVLALPASGTDDLAEGVALACAEAFGRRGVRRLVARVASDAVGVRRVLHRNAFRLEGVERAAIRRDHGFVDVLCYARLAGDPSGGPEAFTAVMNTVSPRKRLIAHALVTDMAGRLLLCETTFKPDWELPGGIAEPFESPGAAATREMIEEMAWAPALRGLLVADWLRPYQGWEDALELVFDTVEVAEPDKARFHPDGVEVRALHWVPPADLDAVMTPFGAARARSAVQARTAGVTLYTEGGVPV